MRVSGDLVDLRPLSPGDIGTLTAPGTIGEFNDFGALDPDWSADDTGRAAVVGKDGSLLGSVSWQIVRYGPNRGSRAWRIGINLVPSARGRGFGAEAQRLLAEHLLATTDVDRVQAETDVENHAEQRALEKAGFTRDGVLRGAQFRAGRRHDIAVYSRLRSDSGAEPG